LHITRVNYCALDVDKIETKSSTMIFFGSLESPELEEFICSTSGHSEATGIEHRGIGFDRKMKVALISA